MCLFMRIGLLVCDHVSPELRGISGDYEDMFRRLFADHGEVDIVAYDVIVGDLPSDPEECDAWLTTGSRHSVNDDETWIRALEGFIRTVAETEVPFIGICFGHQMLAKALGGSVVRSEQGWGVGVKEVEVRPELGLGKSYRVLTSHQDQVETIPSGGEILGWNEHCPVSMLRVGSKMLGIQGHPEFDPAYSRALMELRRGRAIPEPIVEEGLASLDQAPDSGRLAEWIVGMIRSDTGRSV
jgi:GMP synthase-like glutamine amidotransferase